MNLSSKIVMIRPSNFGSNPETLETNVFQAKQSESRKFISSQARKEFDHVVAILKENSINVMVLEEAFNEGLSDAVFPNNWFSTHSNGTLVLYPMLSVTRRKERRDSFINLIKDEGKYNSVLNLSQYESEGHYLEGTGSIVFDHIHKKAYCAHSPRSNRDLFYQVCESLGYQGIYFESIKYKGQYIYHTNVMMAISQKSCIVCLDLVKDKKKLLDELSDLKIIEISIDQMLKFSGNVLMVQNKKGAHFWLMSESAFLAYNRNQIMELENEAEIISIPIPVIEKYGGGSLRCMIAQLF